MATYSDDKGFYIMDFIKSMYGTGKEVLTKSLIYRAKSKLTIRQLGSKAVGIRSKQKYQYYNPTMPGIVCHFVYYFV